jgi:hypothetical protein
MTDNHNALGPLSSAFLASQDHREALSDLSAQEINALSFEEWARRTGQPTLGQIAAQSTAYADTEARSGVPTGGYSLPSNSAAPQAGPGLAQGITDAEFLQWRSQRGSQGEGVGIFSGVMSNSAEYRQAAGRQAGRNAMITSNVTGPTVPMGREQMVANLRASEAAQLDNRADRFRGWGR